MQQYGKADGREVISIIRAYRKGDEGLLEWGASSLGAIRVSVVNLSYCCVDVSSCRPKGSQKEKQPLNYKLFP